MCTPCRANGNLLLLITMQMAFQWRNLFRITWFRVGVNVSSRKSHTIWKMVRFLCIRNRCETCVGAKNFEHAETLNIRITLSRINVRRKFCNVHKHCCKMIQLFVCIKSTGGKIALYTFSWCRMILSPPAGYADGCVRSHEKLKQVAKNICIQPQ